MRIQAVRLFRYKLPFSEPLHLRHATLHEREGLLIEIIGENGHSGWGEAAPLPGFSRESLEDVEQQALSLTEHFVGRDVNTAALASQGTFEKRLADPRIAPSLRFGMELAVVSLAESVEGVPFPALAGVPLEPVVLVNGLLVGSAGEVMAEMKRLQEEGYKAVKLKLGRLSMAEEVDLVRAVCRAAGDAMTVRLDANRAWSIAEAAEFARQTAGCRYEYIEEPLANPAELQAFVSVSKMPIALDETLLDVSLDALGKARHVSAVILKPTLLGGLSRAVAIGRTAMRMGMVPVVTTAFESGVALRGMIKLAAALHMSGTPAGFDTYRRLAEDVLEPRIDMAGGRIDVEKMVREPFTIRRDLLTEVTAPATA